MPFQDDVQDDTEADFVREAFTVRVRRTDTNEIVRVLEFPELRIPASERQDEEQQR